MSNFDENHYFHTLKSKKYSLFVCDEVGRGPIAGPVVSCCLYIPQESLDDELLVNLKVLGIKDSKKLSASKRAKILTELNFKIEKLETNSIYSLELAGKKLYMVLSQKSPGEIDEINILQASLLSMKEGCEKLVRGLKIKEKGIILIDGNQRFTWPDSQFAVVSLIKGDQKSLAIGLASIVAKEFRDYQMQKYHKEFPQYGFNTHAGYPTKIHKAAVKEHGVLPIHRKSFSGVKEYLLQE